MTTVITLASGTSGVFLITAVCFIAILLYDFSNFREIVLYELSDHNIHIKEAWTWTSTRRSKR